MDFRVGFERERFATVTPHGHLFLTPKEIRLIRPFSSTRRVTLSLIHTFDNAKHETSEALNNNKKEKKWMVITADFEAETCK